MHKSLEHSVSTTDKTVLPVDVTAAKEKVRVWHRAKDNASWT